MKITSRKMRQVAQLFPGLRLGFLFLLFFIVLQQSAQLKCYAQHNAMLRVGGRVTRRLGKNCQIFQRIDQKVAKSKKAKISTTKLNLKAQYIKPLLKP